MDTRARILARASILATHLHHIVYQSIRIRTSPQVKMVNLGQFVAAPRLFVGACRIEPGRPALAGDGGGRT